VQRRGAVSDTLDEAAHRAFDITPKVSMKLMLSGLLIGASLGCTRPSSVVPGPNERAVEYRGGRWFDGVAFVERPMYVVGSVLRERRPSRVDSVVNLDGRFVVPPFADAHQHLFDPSRASAFVARQVHDGIFYIKEQSGAPMARRIAERALSAPGGVDTHAVSWVASGEA